MGRRKRTGGPTFSLFAFQDIVTCVMGIMLLLTLMMSLQIESTPETQIQSKARDRADLLVLEASRLLSEIERMEGEISLQSSALSSGALLDSTLLGQSRDRALQDAASAEVEAQRVRTLVQMSASALEEIRSRFGEMERIGSESAILEREVQEKRTELDEVKSGRRRIYNAHESNSKSCWIVELASPEDIHLAVMGDEANVESCSDISALEKRITQLKDEDVAVMLLVKPNAANSLAPLSKALIEMKVPFGFDLLPQDVVVLVPALEQIR